MGIGSLGFLSGASGTMLKSIEAREEAERKIKLEKDLIKLRADTEEVFERKKVSGAPQYDPTTKKNKYYNAYGDVIKEEDASQAQVDAYDAAVKKRTLDAQKDQLDYDNAKEDQRMQRETHSLGLKATQAQINASNRSGRPSIDSRDSEPADTMGVRGGKQLVAEYSTLVAAAVKAGLNPGLVEQWAVRQVANTRTGDEARQKFVQSLKAYIDEANTRKRNETNPTDPFDPKNPTFNWR